MTELWELSAAEIATRVRRRDLPVERLVRSLLTHIDELEPSVRAWQTLDRSGALDAAAALDRRLAAGENVGPLAGVALGLKDLYDVAGLPTTAGSPVLANNVARQDAAAAARLRAAGAVILGKTITTAFAYADPAVTANPWNLAHTPGGSSSGSAAAVAARMIPAALGTQTAGSGLRPAGYCGVVGFKPSYGRVSRRGIWPLSWSMDTAAIHARSVEDVGLILGAIAGPDPRDATTLTLPELDLAAPRPAAALCLGLVRELVERAEPELREHLGQTVARLRAAGARVDEVRLPFSNEQMIAVHHVVQQVEAALIHQELFPPNADRYPDKFRAYLEVGQALPGTAYVQAQRVRRQIAAAVARLFDDCDALVLPVASGPAPPRSSTGSYVMLAAWTLLGLPSATLPSGLSDAGLPLAIQLVGRYGADAELLATARWCEQVLGPLPPPALAGAPAPTA